MCAVIVELPVCGPADCGAEGAEDLKRQTIVGGIKDFLTLTSRHWRIPGVIAMGGLLAHGCAFSNQLVPPVASPAYHAVKMTPGLAHYKAVLWGVWGTAVHG